MDTKEELFEGDYIQDNKARPSPVYWLLFIVAMAVIATVFFVSSRLNDPDKGSKPFLRVTNREFSLFLWQNPEFMRQNYKDKTGYLPGFNTQKKVTPKKETADEFVSAPPEVLFRYHTWKRLVGDYAFTRPIAQEEFEEFLAYDEQWIPMPHTKEAKAAFIGWKNFYKEGEHINKMQYTYGFVSTFFSQYPGYARSHWQNIYPNYLASIDTADPSAKVPPEEIPSFLRVALYNLQKINEIFIMSN